MSCGYRQLKNTSRQISKKADNKNPIAKLNKKIRATVTTHLYGWGEVRHNSHPDPSLFLDDKFVLIFNKIIQK